MMTRSVEPWSDEGSNVISVAFGGGSDAYDLEPFEAQQPLKGGGGGGTSGDVTEDWKDSVETRLTTLHDDLRSILRWGGGAVVFLFMAIAGLYLRYDGKFETVNGTLSNMQVDQQRIEGKIDTQAARQEGKLDILIERSKGQD